MIEINKQLIKQVFPDSMFKQLARPTVSQTAINVKPGQWVWEDGQGNTYSLDGVTQWHIKSGPDDEAQAMYEVYLHLSQLHGHSVERC
ncbi:hypothetical protein [Spartinivicinus poritis]|uniref:Uncharacterized protein n=1 Tax=Spartinivicinus poritis TaxID=2994640 RepID=A0ABT5UEL5_9GAMM|nr:hypothetical protein [Spartinivicinus sp. A2-2]MDE1464811.1 hypothetical protein [Spartinivicinus sp. A2-2]